MCIFHNKHKTLHNLFSPDPFISHPEVYTLHSICCITFRSFYFFSHGCVHMEQMDFISSIFVRILSKLSGKHFIDHTLQMYSLIISHYLCILH